MTLSVLGVAEGVRQIGAVNMDHLNNCEITIDDVEDHLAPKFSTMFASLLGMMQVQESKEHAKQERQSKAAQTSNIMPESPKTPDRPTVPPDPDLSGGTTQSKDEESTKFLLANFVQNSLSVLHTEFRKINWSRSQCRLELYKTYFQMSSR